jgi:peptide/nickel transport system ATP-binding protein
MSEQALLAIQALRVRYPGDRGAVSALGGLDLTLTSGECLAVVGESGSGKTQLLLAVLGLCGPTAQVSGSIRYRGQELIGLPTPKLNEVRGRRIGMVFQDPLTALNPYLRVGVQITEMLRQHRGVTGRSAKRRAIELLEQLHVADAAERMRQYPHQLSGGMRQRVTIAMAMIAQPQILLADEPSTALDVTVQAQVLGLLRELRERTGTTIVLVTHDLGVAAQFADRVAVMHAGVVVEQAPVRELFAHPRHPRTVALQSAMPRIDIARRTAAPRTASALPEPLPLLSVRALSVRYRVVHQGRAVSLPAVNGVSFDLARSEALGVVGESGSGKSSIARALLRLVDAQSGSAQFLGVDLLRVRGAQLLALRRHLQLVFQDPLSSLDPRMPVGKSVAEPLRAFEPRLTAVQRLERAAQMLQVVGLDAEQLQRYPHEFSGGQAQRIAIARALIAAPDLIVCDEALSALDVSIRSQISALLQQLQRERQLSLLFISHDLAAVQVICDRVLVLYLGRVLEIAQREALFAHSRHPYTRALISAVPLPDPELAQPRQPAALEGEIPSPLSAPSGCVFRTRCPLAAERCAREVPQLRQVGASLVACHRAEEVTE